MSWAWRSFVSQSHPLLLSSLRPVRRHGSQLPTVLGRNNLIGSRGYASDSSGDDATTKRHLYVVLDDHKDGFGVHKLDLTGDDDHMDGGGSRRLPEPPVFRVDLTTLGARVQFAAVGSSIVAIGTTLRSPLLYERFIPGPIGGVLIYNTNTGALTVTPHLPTGLTRGGYKAAMAVGNSLYMLGSQPPFPRWDWDDCEYEEEEDDGSPSIIPGYCGGSLHSLTTNRNPVDTKGNKFWGWHLISSSSPWFWSHFQRPPIVPFSVENITAYGAYTSSTAAVVQHELLVSLRPRETSVVGATFSFSTESREWTRHGEWYMPVVGHIHYDSELEAWVGLHAIIDENKHGPPVTDGHLCVGNFTSSPSDWKVGKEKLFRLDKDDAAGWRHVDAKLVQIAPGGGGSEYCLMERLRLKEDVEEVEEDKEDKGKKMLYWGEGAKCLLRLCSFHVERGQDGEPIATARWPARSYEVAWHSRHFDAGAFWM